MTEGSLKLKETARTSRSYTEMTSTFPWHQSVTAFCQWTILRGSYDALSSSVCSKEDLRRTLHDEVSQCQRLAGLTDVTAEADRHGRRMKDCKKLATAALLTLAALTAACASSGKIRPQPFPSPASPGSTIAPQP